MPHREEFRRRAQTLRRDLTQEERRLWYDFLRAYPVQFKRQAVFGDYIVDFYCPRVKLVIEVDGSQHYEGEGPEYDRQRTEQLEQEYGLTILRFSNLDVKQTFEGVCLEIDKIVTSSTKEPSPLRGEGGTAKGRDG